MDNIIIILMVILTACIVLIATIYKIRKVHNSFNEVKEDLLEDIGVGYNIAQTEKLDDNYEMLPSWAKNEVEKNIQNLKEGLREIEASIKKAEKNLYGDTIRSMQTIENGKNLYRQLLKLLNGAQDTTRESVKTLAKLARKSVESAIETTYDIRKLVSSANANGYNFEHGLVQLTHLSACLAKQKENLRDQEKHREILRESEADERFAKSILLSLQAEIKMRHQMALS